jgi:hypothetical protein
MADVAKFRVLSEKIKRKFVIGGAASLRDWQLASNLAVVNFVIKNRPFAFGDLGHRGDFVFLLKLIRSCRGVHEEHESIIVFEIL